MAVTVCAHCGDGALIFDAGFMAHATAPRFLYCDRECWTAGPRAAGVALQDRDVRGATLPPMVVAEPRSRSYRMPYAADPMFGPSDSPAHIQAAAEGLIALQRLLIEKTILSG